MFVRGVPSPVQYGTWFQKLIKSICTQQKVPLAVLQAMPVHRAGAPYCWDCMHSYVFANLCNKKPLHQTAQGRIVCKQPGYGFTVTFSTGVAVATILFVESAAIQ